MPFVVADRVRETTTSTGTGTITLSGTAPTGFQTFGTGIGNANNTFYTIAGGSEWEVGIGTYTAVGTTLSRDTVLASSAGGTTKVTFSAGTKDVFVTYPAGRSVYQEGSITAALGSVTAPSYSFVGDTNTGMFSPAADTLAFAEGGVEAMRITSAGELLVGTTTALSGSKVVVSAGGVHAQAVAANGSPDSYADGGGLMLSYAGGTGSVRAYANASGTGSSIINFLTNGTERMRIDSAGLVGIGTSAPAASLHVVNSSIAAQFRLQDVTTDATRKYGVIGSGHYTNAEEPLALITGDSSASANDMFIGGGPTTLNAMTSIRFLTAANNTTLTGTERMRIDSAGIVGVGTTSPASYSTRFAVVGGNLGVSEDGATVTTIRANANVSNIGAFNATGATLTFSTAPSGSGEVERMRITSTGLVGIGATPSAARLEVNGSIRTTVGSGGTLTLFETDATRANQLVSGADASGSYINASFATGGSAVLRIQTANTERMRVDASGNVGIGVSSVSGKLDVVGGATQRKIQVSGSAFTDTVADVFISRTGTNSVGLAQAPSLQFGNATDASGVILQGSNQFQVFTNNAGAGWIERMRISAVGDVGIGTGSPVNYSGFTTLDIDNATNGGLLNIKKAGTTVGYIHGSSGMLMLGNAVPITLSATGSNQVQFLTNSLERMRITGGGDVGIGTSAPGGELEIYNTSTGPTVRMNTNFAGGNAVDLNPFILGVSNAGYSLSIGGTIREVIDSSGNMGVGVTSPAARIDARVDNPTRGIIYVGRNDGASAQTGSQIQLSQNAIADWAFGQPAGANAFAFWSGRNVGADGTERMRLTSGGDLGVGTSSPSTRIHASGSTANTPTIIRAQQTTTGNNFDYAACSVNTSGATGGIVAWATGSLRAGQVWVQSDGSQPLILGTNDTERVRIDTSGNMGVGTASPWERISLPFNTGLALGSSTYSFKIQRSSAGDLVTTFSDTYDASTARVDFTMRSGAGAQNTPLSILGSGNVGFGTTTPASRLAVAGTTAITWAASGTSSGLVTIGDQGTSGSSLFLNTPSLNSSFASGFGVDGSYTNPGGVGTSIINLKAFGVNSGGGYGSDIAFHTAVGSTLSEKFRITSTGAITSSNLADAVGYKGIPQNSQTASYTLALSDMGKHISITTGGVVIPANGSVAFPIGSAVTIFNNSGSNQTISITTDTLRQAGTANTGSRTLAQYGVATVLKVTSTVWVISGAGVS